MKIVDPNPKFYIEISNITLHLTFYKYCIKPVELINKIVASKIYSIAIQSDHDIVPTIIKCKTYYLLLKRLHFIKCSDLNDIKRQIIEVNYILFNKYFPFYNRHIAMSNRILNHYKKYKKVGIHVRLNDKCLKSCKIDNNLTQFIYNLSLQYYKANNIIFLSSFNKKFTNNFKNISRRVIVYKPELTIKHSVFHDSFNQQDIDKTVVDICLISKADILLLNGYSTFSLLILYKGSYSNYKTCKMKMYKFWDNRELYDHLERFRSKKTCNRSIEWVLY